MRILLAIEHMGPLWQRLLTHISNENMNWKHVSLPGPTADGRTVSVARDDVIVIDPASLPEGTRSAIEAIAQLRADNKNLCIIILSSRDDMGLVPNCLNAGANDAMYVGVGNERMAEVIARLKAAARMLELV